MSELARRVAVAVVGVPIVVGAVYAGQLPLALFLGALGGLGAWELYRLARATGLAPLESIGIPVAAAIPLYVVLNELGVLRSPAAIAAVTLLAMLGTTLWSRGPSGRPLESVAVTAFGAVYAGGMLAFVYLLRHHRFVSDRGAGTALVMYPVVLTWASDIGAYFVGRWFGHSKLMPTVSPGKTRAGAIGGLALTVAASAAYNLWVLGPVAQLALAPWTALVFGAVVSVAAQVGDLVESMLKRQANVKDSSQLLPGHGGILDRMDSLYFVLPVAHLVLSRLLVPAPR